MIGAFCTDDGRRVFFVSVIWMDLVNAVAAGDGPGISADLLPALRIR